MRWLVVVLCSVAVVIATFAQGQQTTKQPRKKKASATQTMQQQDSTQAAKSSDPRIGTTKAGKVVYRGKKGGLYIMAPSGKKRYVKAEQVIFDEGQNP